MAGGPARSQRHPDLQVVICSFHCRDQVLAAVESVLGSVYDHTLLVTVVDNGSTDGTVPALRERFGEVQVLEMGENAGFARANNRGMAASDSRYVMVLNPDTVVEPAALDRLVDFLDAHPDAGVAAPRLVNPDGSDQLTARSFPTPSAALFGRRSPLTRLAPQNRFSARFLAGRSHTGDEAFEIDWVSGAAMMLPRSVIDRVGGFDEEFFLFWEDADWCRRIVDAGYQVWCVPKARIVHDEGGTRAHGWPPVLVGHFHRGAYLYWRNHHAPQAWNPLRWAALVALSCRARAIVTRDRALAAGRRIRRPDPSIAQEPS